MDLLRNGSEERQFWAFGIFSRPLKRYPKHDTQKEANGHFWVYVVWERCKVVGPLKGQVCPDSDVLATAADGGTSGSPIASPVWSHPFAISAGVGSEFSPWIRVDSSSRQILNISYYTMAGDASNHRVVYRLQQISPCAGTAPCPLDPSPNPFSITTALDEPQGDALFGAFPFGFGDYHGVAARGNGTVGASRAVPAFTGNYRVGSFNGALSPDTDNYISRFDY